MNHALILLAPPYAHHEHLLDWLCRSYDFMRFDLPTQIERERKADSDLWRQLAPGLPTHDKISPEQFKALLWSGLEANTSNRVVFNNFPWTLDQLAELDKMLDLFGFTDRRCIFCNLPEPEMVAEVLAHDDPEADHDLLTERIVEAVQRFEDRTQVLRNRLQAESGYFQLDAQQAWDLIEGESAIWLDEWLEKKGE